MSEKNVAQSSEEFRNVLEVFDNRFPDRDYVNEITHPEWVSTCPKTGFPDFAQLKVTYIADKKCIELKSFKLYCYQFKNEGCFYEILVNRILDDLVAACQPREMSVEMKFTPRGGISSHLTAVYSAD